MIFKRGTFLVDGETLERVPKLEKPWPDWTLKENFLVQWTANKGFVKDILKGEIIRDFSIDEDDRILNPIIIDNWILIPTEHKLLYLLKM